MGKLTRLWARADSLPDRSFCWKDLVLLLFLTALNGTAVAVIVTVVLAVVAVIAKYL